MQYPLIDRELLAYLRLAHGMFNVSMMCLFIYQGWIGLKVRRARIAQAPLPLQVIKRHRKAGPVLTILGVLGFLSGTTLVLLHAGKIFEYPTHLFTGIVIVTLLIASLVISRRIKGSDSSSRTPHFMISIAVLCLYPVNVFLGIGELL